MIELARVFEENLVALLIEQRESWRIELPSCELCGLRHRDSCLDHQLRLLDPQLQLRSDHTELTLADRIAAAPSCAGPVQR